MGGDLYPPTAPSALDAPQMPDEAGGATEIAAPSVPRAAGRAQYVGTLLFSSFFNAIAASCIALAILVATMTTMGTFDIGAARASAILTAGFGLPFLLFMVYGVLYGAALEFLVRGPRGIVATDAVITTAAGNACAGIAITGIAAVLGTVIVAGAYWVHVLRANRLDAFELDALREPFILLFFGHPISMCVLIVVMQLSKICWDTSQFDREITKTVRQYWK